MSSVWWKKIDGYDYEISEDGQVMKTNTGEILKASVNTLGYYTVGLCKNGKVEKHLVHQLVCQAFIEKPNNVSNVCHKNSDRLDNRVENLHWASKSHNPWSKGQWISKSGRQWSASIKIDGKIKNLGLYKTLEDARQACSDNRL